MKATRYWLQAVTLDLLILSLFYIWQSEGTEQAGNVVVFWLWFITIVRILVGIGADKTSFAERPRPAGFVWYHGVTEFATISALAWFGYTLLPAFYLIGTMLVEGARKREPKTEGGAACN